MADTMRKFEFQGMKFSVVSLPGSGFFQYEAATDIGADFETAYMNHTGRWVYGMAHLIEHLSFKSPKDFTTDDFMHQLKTKGSYNAFTNTDRIHYFFSTISKNANLAITLVANMTYNDLTGITQHEFESERSVVANEIRRYHDDSQTIFAFQAGACAFGRNKSDNILGDADLLENFTLFDCTQMKGNFIKHANVEHRITFDPDDLYLDDIVLFIWSEVNRITSSNITPSILLSRQSYDDCVRKEIVKIGEIIDIESDAEQCLISLHAPFTDTTGFYMPVSQAVNFVAHVAKTSVNEYIREQNGLTYGISMSHERINGDCILQFSVDVEPSKYEFAIELMKKAFNDTAVNFNEEQFNEMMESYEVQIVPAMMNRKSVINLHSISESSPNWAAYSEDYATDSAKARRKIVNDWFTFHNVKNVLYELNGIIQNDKFVLVCSNRPQ